MNCGVQANLSKKPTFENGKLVSKGQLFSNGLLGVFDSSKNEQKQVELRYHSTVS